MKLFLITLVLLAVYTPVVKTAEPADTKHLPPPCVNAQLKPPPVAYCPESYIRLVPLKPDDMFDSAWYCRTNNFTMTVIKGGSGCGGSSGLAMIDDKWALPRKPPPPKSSPSIDYRSEIFGAVINPCTIVIYRRMGGVYNTMTTSEILELAKLSMPTDWWETLIKDMISHVKGESKASRNVIYEHGRKTCINAGYP